MFISTSTFTEVTLCLL